MDRPKFTQLYNEAVALGKAEIEEYKIPIDKSMRDVGKLLREATGDNVDVKKSQTAFCVPFDLK